MSFQKLTPEELRAHKGKSFTGITTVFLCHDGAGKLFLAKRSKKARDEHGRWDPGGGGLKHGQSVEESLLREVKEEYGTTPLTHEFIGYFDAFRTAPDGTETHWLALCFAVLVDPETVQICEPELFDDSGWFMLDALPSPMHSQFQTFMDKHGEVFERLLWSTPSDTMTT